MSTRYWFYVRGTGSLEGRGEHRVCFSTSDSEASLTAVLQSVFCVKTPVFKTHLMLDEDGEVLQYPQARAALHKAHGSDHNEHADGECASVVHHLAFVSFNAVLSDLLAYAQAGSQRTGQEPPPPTMYLLVDCEALGAHTPS